VIKCIFHLVVVTLFAVPVFAETVGLTPRSLNLPGLELQSDRPEPFSLGDKIKGLMASDRLSFQNTAGISFTSGAGGNLNQYYMNTITYKANKPLIIKAQVGVQHNLYGSSTFGAPNGGNTRLVVPYFGVLYQPRDNIQIEFQFSNQPSSYHGRRGYPY